jgi:hypothetical protein
LEDHVKAQDESKWTHYSVVKPVKLNNVKKQPSVCYEIDRSAVKQMETLAAKGIVRLYDHPIRFVSGAPVEVKQKPALEIVQAQAPAQAKGEFAPENDAEPAERQ